MSSKDASEGQQQHHTSSSQPIDGSRKSAFSGRETSSSSYRERPSFLDPSSSPRHAPLTTAELQPPVSHGWRKDLPAVKATNSSDADLLTPPSSPQSPSLKQWNLAFGRHTSSSADPFSGSAKAPSMAHHPSFGKQFPHVKHPHRSSLGTKLTGKRRAANDHATATASETTWSEGVLPPSSSIASGVMGRKGESDQEGGSESDVFKAVFQDGDGATTSSDDAFDFGRGGARSSLDEPDERSLDHTAAAGLSGLGLGSAFEYQTGANGSVSTTRPTGQKRSAYSRNTSHPYEAFGSASHPRSPQQQGVATNISGSSLIGSPGSRAPAARRVRMAGSSPRQLTIARATRIPGESDEEIADDEGFPSSDKPGSDLFPSAGHKPLRAWERYESRDSTPLSTVEATEIVSRAVAKAFDTSKPTVDLSSRGLHCLSPAIAELGDYVGIHPLASSTEWIRGAMSRTVTETSIDLNPSSSVHSYVNNDAAVAAGNSLASPPRSLSQPIRANLAFAHTDPCATKLFLNNNLLTVLPSALFAVSNLSVLSLRANALKELPSAIGTLTTLRELNIGNNQLKHLPAEMQKLHLQTFTYHPNPWVVCPSGSKLRFRPSRGLLSTVAAHSEAPTIETQAQLQPPSGNMSPPPLPVRSSVRIESESAEQPSTISTSVYSGMPDLASYAGSRATADARAASQGEASATLQPAAGTEDAESASRKRKRNTRAYVLGGLQVQGANGVPSLRDLCTRIMLEMVDVDAGEGSARMSGRKRRRQVRLEELPNGVLRDLTSRGQLNEASVRLLESARRSAKKLWNSRPDLAAVPAPVPLSTSSGFPKRTFKTWCSGADVFSASNTESPALRSSSNVLLDLNERGDNALENPWFNRCPNQTHHATGLLGDDASSSQLPPSLAPEEIDWPLLSTRLEDCQLFLNSAETRIEWVSHIGGIKVASGVKVDSDAPNGVATGSLADESGCLPILWRGCKRGCLDFLEPETDPLPPMEMDTQVT